MRHIEFREVEGRGAGFLALILLLALVTLAGVLAGHHMDAEGHHVTGMNNRVVWGLPHVFAVFLIVAASGALNVASLSSVFGRAAYEPLARLSGVLAIALLSGGLAVLVLDLGRPDRLVVAMTHYNVTSIFAWNILLYTGFMAVAVVYLWMHMERRMQRHVRRAGLVAFAWRIVLTTGTGCIFGFLVARQAYDAAIMAPLFVAMSLSLGLAVFILVLTGTASMTARPLDEGLLRRLARLQALFVSVVLYFVVARHLANLYVAEHGSAPQRPRTRGPGPRPGRRRSESPSFGPSRALRPGQRRSGRPAWRSESPELRTEQGSPTPKPAPHSSKTGIPAPSLRESVRHDGWTAVDGAVGMASRDVKPYLHVKGLQSPSSM